MIHGIVFQTRALSSSSPADQHGAYVDEHDAPPEMAKEVHSEKGTTCIIKGCDDHDLTLDHIVAWDTLKRTSVDNLQPMCKSHNSSKGTEDFSSWLEEEGLETR